MALSEMQTSEEEQENSVACQITEDSFGASKAVLL